MASHNDPVQPIPFDVIQPAPAPAPTSTTRTPDAAPHRGTPRWVLPALALLLLLAILVIFWLPANLQAPPSSPDPNAAGSAAAVSAGAAPAANTDSVAGQASPAAPDGSPWSDAQAARWRKEAQDILQQLLDVQFALQERGVEQWAPDAFAKVATGAAEGDALYKNRQYTEAAARYKAGLEALQALQESMPQELQRLLAQAQAALEQGDAIAALAALKVAALIAPDNKDIASLQHRATVLPQLLPLLAEAVQAETAGDLSKAQQLLQQATTLDPQHPRAQSELQRVAAKARGQGFSAAMSEGYAALNQGRFDSARKAFNTAAKLQPGSAEATSALQEVATAETARRLASLDQQGRQEEQQEQWQKAVEAYERAQKIDRGVLFASDGLKRSRARAQLDQQIRTALADPQRLADSNVAAATAQVLRQAQQISPRGPLLEQQIRALDTLMRQASVTVTVTLRSDKETEVTVQKVARLGRFAEHALTLRPGTYTAVGTRNGYRDVRQSFTVTHDQMPAPLTIICTDPI